MLRGIWQGQEIGMLHGIIRMVIEFLATLCISGDDPRVVPGPGCALNGNSGYKRSWSGVCVDHPDDMKLG